MNLRALLGLGAFLGINIAVAALGSILTMSSLDSWYRELNKPNWGPPDWVFGPVWTMLYTMIAVAGWLAWRRASSSERPAAMRAYGVQLGLNLAWSGLFFGLRSPLLGMVGIIALWGAIVWTLAVFWRISRLSALLLVPYLGWVTFAGGLNVSLWWTNR